MRKVHLLLGGAERSLNRVIEASVFDVCYNRAAVETTGAIRLGQFSRQGSLGSFDLMILIPECLLPEPNLGGNHVPLDHALATVRTLKQQISTPLIILTASAADQRLFLEAGADAVITEFFQTDRLKAELRRLLGFPEPTEAREMEGWSVAALFFRGLQRLKRA